MRSKTAAVLVGSALLLVGAPIAGAKAGEHRFTGELSRIDASAKTLVVKDRTGTAASEMSFRLAPSATIMQGPKAKSLGELRVGERVTVTYADQGTAHEAQRIEVLAPKTAKAPTHSGSSGAPPAKSSSSQ